MSVGRRGPLSFLDTEWRTALWKRWVATHLVNDGNGSGPIPHDPPSPVASVSNGTMPAAVPAPAVSPTADGPVTSNDVLEAAQAVPRRAPPAEDRRNERRADVRARFDALSERLQGLEDAIDVIARRLSHRSRRESRSDRRTTELVEGIAETVEAHALTLESLGTTLERIERRLERIERPSPREERESRAAKA